MSATPTGHLLYILDSHTASEQCYRQEETDQKHRDDHDHPGNGLEASVTQGLECGRADHTDRQPPHETAPRTGEQVVDRTGDRDQKNC
jgi:hypothetical protein